MNTTVIAEKLQAAGVRIPTAFERIWRVVHDHPGGITAKRIREITGIDIASTYLSQLASRGMVTEATTTMRTSGRWGSMERKVKTYTTTLKEYQLLPKKKKMPSPSEVEPPREPQKETLRAPPTVSQARAFVESMTVAEARELWSVLNPMFGGVK